MLSGESLRPYIYNRYYKARQNAHIVRSRQGSRKSLCDSPLQGRFFRPVLVGEVTSTTSRRDQYYLLWMTSTGPIADQYWSLLSPAVHSEEIAPKQALLIRGNSPLLQRLIPPSREGSASPLTEEGEMPHRTSSRATYIGRRADLYRFAS